MAAALKLVRSPPSTEQLLRETIAGRDEAAAALAHADRLIVELAHRLWHERNPGQRLMMKMRPERARGMVGL